MTEAGGPSPATDVAFEDADAPVGRLVLVVGPSGAGKDAVIGGARARLAGDDRFVFPRRMVTRVADGSEAHDSCDAERFEALDRAGAFALSWHAHGHGYGVPATVRLDLAEGRTVVANVSRGVVESARQLLPPVTVVEITAPPAVLAARVAARGRSSDGDANERVGRKVEPVRADVTIDNAGALDDAVARFLDVLRSGTARV